MNWDQVREHLKDLRADKGWTQRKLAAAMMVNQSSVSDHEYGRTRPNLESLARWADALGVRILIAIRNGTVNYSVLYKTEGE